MKLVTVLTACAREVGEGGGGSVCLQHDLNRIAAGKKKTETASVGFRTKFSSNGVTPLAPITPARPVTGLLTRAFPPSTSNHHYILQTQFHPHTVLTGATLQTSFSINTKVFCFSRFLLFLFVFWFIWW
jgi:hypothetical protein